MNLDREIQEKMEELTRRRRKGSLSFFAGVICPFLLMLLPEGSAWWKGWLIALCVTGTIFLIIYGLIVWIDAVGRLKDILSETLVPEALCRAFTQVDYQQNRHIPREIIEAALIPHYWDSMGGNDYVRANYNGIPIEFSDMRMTYETGSSDDRRTRSAFRGPYIICSIAQSFPAEMVLVDRKKGRSGAKHAGEGLQLISSGYEDFDRKFLLLADNLEGAYSILTPQVVNGLLRLHEFTGDCSSLKVTRDGKVHIAVNSGCNLFEPGKRIEEAEQRITEEISYITDIVDMLYSAPK